MKIELKLYANLRKYYPREDSKDAEKDQIKLESEATLKDLMDKIDLPEEEAKMIFVNNRKQSKEYKLKDGDTVAIFPPIAGG